MIPAAIDTDRNRFGRETSGKAKKRKRKAKSWNSTVKNRKGKAGRRLEPEKHEGAMQCGALEMLAMTGSGTASL